MEQTFEWTLMDFNGLNGNSLSLSLSLSLSCSLCVLQYSGQKDLESEFGVMQGIYVEKEGESNWMKREKSLQRLRGLVAAGAAADPFFISSLKKLTPCITESVSATSCCSCSPCCCCYKGCG